MMEQKYLFKPATSDFLQHIDYRYNIRGWLTSINNAELERDGAKNLDDLDVFGEEIYYDQTDAITIDNTQDNPFVPLNKFNGNISAIRWKSRAPDIAPDTKPENIYCYRYDDLNRMTAAYYAKSEIGMPGFFNTDYHLFNEKLSYDLDGNIRSLDREHSDGTMDDLLYSYDGHKLMEVTDAITAEVGNGFTDGNTSGDDYTYDVNGNLSSDLNKALTFQYNHLNLPISIEYGTDELSYLYDATGRKLKTFYPDGTIHDYVSGIEYENNELLFINTSFGRVKATGPQEFCSSNFAYEYFINDHLGSIRAVITREENAPEHNYSATMETLVATTEEAMFYNVDLTRVDGPAALQSYTSSVKAALTNSSGEPIGPAKVLQVQEGDRISIDVKYFYDAYTGGNTPRDINDILTQLANFFILSGTVAPPGLESSWAASTFTGNSAVSAFINTEITSSDPVLAYLAYITLDENFNFIADASGILKADDPDVVSDLNVLDLVMPKNGYIYIYVANESPTDVYFDNLQIIHKKSNVLELSDYYPYGLRNETLSQTSLSFDPMNSYQYQDKELQTALGLNTHEFGLRHYDATLGRWGVQDPMMQFFNPYLAMGNNPVSIIDPTGGIGFSSQGNPKNVGDVTNSSEYQYRSGGGLPGGPMGWGSWGGGTAWSHINGETSINEDYITAYFASITGTNHYGVGADGKSNYSFFSAFQDLRVNEASSSSTFIGPQQPDPPVNLPTISIEDARLDPRAIEKHAFEHYDKYAQGNGGGDKDMYLGIAGTVVGGMELSYLNDAKQVLKYGQRIDGQVRSAETLTRANRISSNATAKYLGFAGKALGIYGAYNSGTMLLNDPSNPANWVKFGANTGMLFMKANPFTFVIGVGYTILDQGGYIDNWIGTKP